ncbi:MAG: transcription-repair coupling factor [Candidatus Bruticola sp.]
MRLNLEFVYVHRVNCELHFILPVSVFVIMNSKYPSFSNGLNSESDKLTDDLNVNSAKNDSLLLSSSVSYSKAKQQQEAHRSCVSANASLSEIWKKDPNSADWVRALRACSSVVCSGLAAPARPLFMQICRSLASVKPVLLWITAAADQAERLFQDCHTFFDNSELWLFPEKEAANMLEKEEDKTDPARLAVLQALDAYKEQEGRGMIIVTTLRALMQPTVQTDKLEKSKLSLKTGENVGFDFLQEILSSEGYSRVTMVEGRGQYAVRGGLIDIYPITGQPARLEFFGDEVESMRVFNINTQRSGSTISEVVLLSAAASESEGESWLTDHLRKKAPHAIAVLEDPIQLRLSAKEWNQEWESQASSGSSIGFIEDSDSNYVWEQLTDMLSTFRRLFISPWTSQNALGLSDKEINSSAGTKIPQFDLDIELAVPLNKKVYGLLDVIPQWQKENKRIILLTSQFMRLQELLKEHEINFLTGITRQIQPGQILLLQGYASEGFSLPLADGVLEFLTDREIMGQRIQQRLNKPAEAKGSNLRLEEIAPGDLVVHLQHGIARYMGIHTISLGGVQHDMLKLEYAKGDCIFVATDQLNLVQKYEGIDGKEPPLSKMNGADWKRTKAKIRAHAAEAAQKLLQIYAQRSQAEGCAYPPDTLWQQEMEDAFPYQETPDQLRAIREVKADLESSRPMDRLICGDVGYGKTEVALRAAFKVVNNNKQVAILAPTTVLAHQHFITFSERLAPYPISIGLLSRFKTTAEQKKTIKELAAGQCDIVIGTHRMLSKDIAFKDLGLLIIDEEQRFGVMHKEKISQLRANVDIMSMSATPIPRTLQMSFYGIREMSVIETPPESRLPIKTYLFERHQELIKAAIVRELSRHGQVYFLHNRVKSIEKEAALLQKLLPQARIAVGHGQMSEQQLEKVMMEFYEGQYDILVCSTIIESGLDVPNVNTIIIDNADTLGLAQLYQLRGRVGRSAKQGYCYLLYQPNRTLTEPAKKRLETIRDFTRLGSGFQIAKRDLEIRGAGNILGAEQSGHVAAVGFGLYCRMLSDAVQALRQNKDPEEEGARLERINSDIVIDMPISAWLPDEYIGDPQQKVVLYKRIASAADRTDLEDIRAELRDRYGKLPELAENLLILAAIKLKCRDLMIPSVKIKDGLMHVAAPLLRQLTPKEKDKLTKLTNCAIRQTEAELCLNVAAKRSVGPIEYPSASELLHKTGQVLQYLENLPNREAFEPLQLI